jgi:predicted phage terminase large subunit-like protein
VIAVDATFGADVNSDYVAIEAVAQIKDLYYLLDLVRKKMTFTETLEEIKLFCMRWRMASKLIIEKAANGQGLADMIAKDKDFVLKAELVSCEGLSKQARLRSVSHLFERHLVYFPSTDLAPWAPTVINEVIYLGSAAHDDTADAFVHALRYLHLGNLQPPKFILPKEDTLRTRFKAPPMWEQRPRF